MTPPRRLHRFVGAPAETARAAAALIGALPPDDVLWIGEADGADVAPVRPSDARRRLGRGYGAVVLDLHRGLAVDALAMAQGFVVAGGALLVRLSEVPAPDPALAVPPAPPEAVGTRLEARLRRLLPDDPPEPPAPIRAAHGSAEQAAWVDALDARGHEPFLAAIIGPRGRGKSTALGMLVARLAARGARDVVVCSASDDGAEAVLRAAPPGMVRCLPPAALAEPTGADAVLVDEAAALPVALLRRAARAHPDVPVLLATTTEGYEGTGRGFALRFLPWMEAQPRPTAVATLRAPIRFAPDDPVERAVLAALVLDGATPPPLPDAEPVPVVLDRDRLAADDALLRQVFGLLVDAHYRTTPSDLHRLLDAPNLSVHALVSDDVVVAVNLVAAEGGLPPDLCAAVTAGRLRPRGQALADTLMSHAGRAEVGGWTLSRSVRLAVRPDARRRGLGARLARAAMAASEADLHGTVFSATPDVIAFRRALGFEVVRVGASPGPRTGEPAVVMVAPRSPRARALVDALRASLACDLDLQLALLAADDPLVHDPALGAALRQGLPAPRSRAPGEIRALLGRYARGPLHFEGVAGALRAALDADPAPLATAPPQVARALNARLRERKGWREAAAAGDFPSVPAAQRALRRWVASWA
jgi:tRNA(Met) cytidine acetyltransferase